MLSKELMDLLVQVISSWQVIFITVVLILYFFLVFYVARLYRKPRTPLLFSSPRTSVKKKAQKAEPAEPEIVD